MKAHPKEPAARRIKTQRQTQCAECLRLQDELRKVTTALYLERQKDWTEEDFDRVDAAGEVKP